MIYFFKPPLLLTTIDIICQSKYLPIKVDTSIIIIVSSLHLKICWEERVNEKVC